MYNKSLNELLNIEKNILKVYDKLIEFSLNNDFLEHEKQIENLSMLIEYEDKKLKEYVRYADKKTIDSYIEENGFDFDTFNSEVLMVDDLYKYRLTILLIKCARNSIVNDDLAEMYVKYIWNINDVKNKKNKEKITKIQYYICYLNKTIESFFIDNMFSFNKKYEELHFPSIDQGLNYKECRNSIIYSQLNYGLSMAEQTKPNSEDYIYYKTFIKSVLDILKDDEYDSYIADFKCESLDRGILLSKILGD